MTFECSHCHRTFARDKTLDTHRCEPRRRWEVQNQRGVQIGFQGYLQFRNAHLPSSDKHTYQDFCRSSYYRAFVKWGDYCVAVQVIDPAQYLTWLLKNQHRIDHWCRDTVYTEYLVWYLPQEPIDQAVKRALDLGSDWQQQQGHPAPHMLRYGNHNWLCHKIVTGQLSAWMIYLTDSGHELLTGLHGSQLDMIWPYITPDQWNSRLAFDSDAVNQYRSKLRSQGW